MAASFNLGSGKAGNRKMEILLAVGLGIVILTALAALIIPWIGPGTPPPPAMHFQCMKCQAEFEMNPKDMQRDPRAPGGRPGAPGGPPGAMGPRQLPFGVVLIDCLKCGAKESAVMEVQCVNPKCKRYFVSDMTKVILSGGNPMQYMQDGQMPDTKCPHCGTMQRQWLEQNQPQ